MRGPSPTPVSSVNSSMPSSPSAVADGNWTFRMMPWMLGTKIRNRFGGMVKTFGRD